MTASAPSTAQTWPTDYQVNMLGHDHIAHQRKSVFRTNLAQDIDTQISGTHLREQPAALLATKRGEVKIVSGRPALQLCRHKSQDSEPTFCKKQNRNAWPTPSNTLISLNDYM